MPAKKRIAEDAPSFAAEPRRAGRRDRRAGQRRRGLSLHDAMELSFKMRRNVLNELAKR